MLKSFVFLFVIASASATANRTIVDLAVVTPGLSTLVTALKAGNLVDTLSGPGPFTVFAPTNEAFAKLPKATLDRLLDPANVNELRNILTYHAAAGKVLSSQIKDGEKIKTVQGQDVTATLFNHRVFINKAEVVRADMKGSNVSDLYLFCGIAAGFAAGFTADFAAGFGRVLPSARRG